jgi:NTP pyrophosphatase (non-canonical NTP hydrolase)
VKTKYVPKTLEAKLGWLVEECGEVLAAVGKTMRHGLDSYNPEIAPEERELNGDWILRELGDLRAAAVLATQELCIQMQAIDGDYRGPSDSPPDWRKLLADLVRDYPWQSATEDGLAACRAAVAELEKHK